MIGFICSILSTGHVILTPQRQWPLLVFMDATSINQPFIHHSKIFEGQYISQIMQLLYSGYVHGGNKEGGRWSVCITPQMPDLPRVPCLPCPIHGSTG
jgi:hypothetical protein